MSAEVTYRAFMLRLWCLANGQWRASLEDPHTGQRQAFASLERLVEYLAQATECGFAAEPAASAAPDQGD